MNAVCPFDLTARPAQRRRTAARAVLLAVACGGAALAAQAQGWTQVQGNGNAGSFDTTVTDAPVFTGTPGPIDLGTWSGGERHYAAASGAQQTLGALAAGSGNGGVGVDYGNQVNTTNRFTWVTPVGAGSSGLNVGDAITVYLDVRVDGKLAAGWGPYFTHPLIATLPAEYHLETQAAVTSRYTLYDLDAPGHEGGDPDLAFSYQGSVYMNAARYGSPYNDDYVQTSFESRAYAERHNTNFWNWSGNDAGSDTVHGGTMPSGKTLDVDTGVQRFEVHTFVGNRLEINGELNVIANAFQGNSENPLSWRAMADFGSTFDAELVSSVPGVEFGGLTAGVYNPAAVPEPSAWALLAGGLAALALVRRCRAA